MSRLEELIRELTGKSNLQLVSQFKFDINGNFFSNDGKQSRLHQISCRYLVHTKILDAIVKIRGSKTRPDLDHIFHDMSRNEAWNIDKDTVQVLMSKLIDSNIITVKKTKQGQKSLFLTKDATAIPTKDNKVFISLNDECQDATPADPNNIDLSATKPKDSGDTKPNPTSNHNFVSLELSNTFYDDY